VVISLDAGGSSEDLSSRRDTIESITDPNPHMRGTIRILHALLEPDLNARSPLLFYAMINAAKCSAIDDRRDMVPAGLYERCRPFASAERKILEPQIVVTQGVQARNVLPQREHVPSSWLQSVLQSLPPALPPVQPWLLSLSNEYLRACRIGPINAVTVEVPHPSARGSQWQLFARLCLDSLAWLVRQLLPYASGQAA